jgi:hypothetical protein
MEEYTKESVEKYIVILNGNFSPEEKRIADDYLRHFKVIYILNIKLNRIRQKPLKFVYNFYTRQTKTSNF